MVGNHATIPKSRDIQLALTSQIPDVCILAFVIFIECHENCKHAAIPNHLRLMWELA
jgi:hypothetical protein